MEISKTEERQVEISKADAEFSRMEKEQVEISRAEAACPRIEEQVEISRAGRADLP